MPQYRQVSQPEPEPQSYEGHTEMHVTRKYGKFHGHTVHSDGSEHHIPPQPSMLHAHQELGKLMTEPSDGVEHAMPENEFQSAKEA